MTGIDFKTTLIRDHSVDTARSVADIAVTSEIRFGELVRLVASEDTEMARRAAWAFGKAGEERPEWLIRHLDTMVNLLRQYSHPAIRRNIYRVLQFVEIPDTYHAVIFDQCLKELQNPGQPAAIKVFAMTVAANIVKEQPELKEELLLSIEDNLPYGSAGFKNRAGKIMSMLK